MQAKRTFGAAARYNAQTAHMVMGGAVIAAGLLLGGPLAAQQAQAPPGAGQVVKDLSPAVIRQVQHSLLQGGYEVDATDGVWGAKTAAAVREFQRVRGLRPTGEADPQTLAALGVIVNGTSQPTTSARRESPPQVRHRTPADLDPVTVRAIQQALGRQGLQVGPTDGVWGDQTTSAIANLQRARGMPASGVPDAHTLGALGLLPGGSERAAAGRSGEPPGPAALDPAAIRLIQQSLARHGQDVGTVDGIWGERTTEALRDFQRANGLESASDLDVHTIHALGLLPSGNGSATSGEARQR